MIAEEYIFDILSEHEQNVCGQFDTYLKKIERTIGVTVISRDGKLKLMGSKQQIESAKQVLLELTELSNGKKVDSRIYPELQKMFNDARAQGYGLFVREGYRTQEEQQQLLEEKIEAYENETALEAHRNSAYFQTYVPQLGGLRTKPSELTKCEVIEF